MPGFIEFVRNQYTKLPVAQAPETIASETYVVTGANTGLGLECAKHLVQKGAARVILAVRSRSKGEAALAAIRQATGRDVCEVWELDLASLDSVEAFAKRLDTLDRLDALIQNAGIAMANYKVVEGMELTTLVNVVSTMLLADRALPKLQSSAQKFNTKPRLVFVASNAALKPNLNKIIVEAKGDIFESFSEESNFGPFTTYPATKLLEIYAVRQLASLLPVSDTGVIINMTSPGLCYTALDRDAPPLSRIMMAIMRRLLARTAEQGSRNLLQAAFAGVEGHGKYYSECQIKEHLIPQWMSGAEGVRTQDRIWEDLVKRLKAMGHEIALAGATSKMA